MSDTISPYQNIHSISGLDTSIYTGQGLITNSNVAAAVWSNQPHNPALKVTSSDGSTAIHAQGDVTVEGNLTVNGTISSPTIESRLDAIESRLAILRPNADLESRWDELKAARERYHELEAEFRRYEQVLDVLKN